MAFKDIRVCDLCGVSEQFIDDEIKAYDYLFGVAGLNNKAMRVIKRIDLCAECSEIYFSTVNDLMQSSGEIKPAFKREQAESVVAKAILKKHILAMQV